jgi:hypothetical protein
MPDGYRGVSIPDEGPISVQAMGRAGEAVAKGLVTVVALVVGVPLVLGLALVIYLTIALRPPDLAKAVKSKAVSDADRATITDLDARLDAAVHLVPGASSQARSVADECNLDSGYKSLKRHVTCNRTVTRYVGLNGDFAKQSAAWDQALQTVGWQGGASSEQRRQLRTQSAEPIRTNPLSRVHYGARLLDLRITWTSRPTVPDVYQDIQRGLRQPDSDDQIYREQTPVDVAALAEQAFGRYRYLVTVEAHLQYYPINPASSPSSSPTPGRGSCHNGSCPGG